MAFTLDNGMLYYDTKVFISNFEDFCVCVFYCHNIRIASHLGFQKIYIVVKKI
jgi:hypothetical protein